GIALGRWRRQLSACGRWRLSALRRRGRNLTTGLLRRGRHLSALRRGRRRGLASLGRRRHLPAELLARVPLRRRGRHLSARLLSRRRHLTTLLRRRHLATLRRRRRSLATLGRRGGSLTAGLLPGRRRWHLTFGIVLRSLRIRRSVLRVLLAHSAPLSLRVDTSLPSDTGHTLAASRQSFPSCPP